MGVAAIIGFAVLIVGMGWLGSKALWKWAAAISVPFFVLAGWLEVTTAGEPMISDPYGHMLLILIFGPLVLGWFAFFGGLALRRAEMRHNSTVQGK